MLRRLLKLLGKKEERYVLDTSIFVNPVARKHFGKEVDEAVKNFLAMAAKTKAKFYMPPSVKKELSYFARQMPNFGNTILVKTPALYELQIPAIIMHRFIDEIRSRVNAGLRISEKYARDQRTDMDEKIRKLREQYKEALREGILDSEEDFEVLMLAKELNAAIITLDMGLAKAAEQMGVRCVTDDFQTILK